jgi:hypothetical protein
MLLLEGSLAAPAAAVAPKTGTAPGGSGIKLAGLLPWGSSAQLAASATALPAADSIPAPDADSFAVL